MSEYWKYKPVMNNDKNYYSTKVINNNFDKEITKDETKLPSGFIWEKVNLNSDLLSEISTFLMNNYDSDDTFYRVYSEEHIKYQLNNTGFFLNIRNKSNVIVGTIGITFKMCEISGESKTIVQPCFMCVHKKCRNKGIGKVLIDESIRVSKQYKYNKGVFFNTEKVLKSNARVRYYSRPLNYRHLKKNGFITMSSSDEDDLHMKLKIKLKPNKKYVKADSSDDTIELIYNLYEEYTKSFYIRQKLSKQEIKNYLLNPEFCETLLVKNNDGDIVDFISYNTYDIINRETSDTIKCANLLMYSSNTVRVDLLIINLMKQVSYDGYHILYIPDMMHTNDVLLTNARYGDEDSDDEDNKASMDLNIIRSRKKYYFNLFNLECPIIKQNNFSYLVF